MADLSRKREDSTALTDEPDQPFFPHSMFLDDEDIKKLAVSDLELGDERQLTARVRVTEISSNADERSGKRSSMVLSLVEGDVTNPTRSRAERVFRGDDGGSQ